MAVMTPRSNVLEDGFGVKVGNTERGSNLVCGSGTVEQTLYTQKVQRRAFT